MNLDDATCRRLFGESRVARLATTGATGPHIVPLVYAFDGDAIVSMVDHKPKRSRDLQRLANLEDDRRAALLADHYTDDWDRLWWVRADVTADVTSDPALMAAAAAALGARYVQYEGRDPAGPLIRMTVTRWVGWAASPAAVGN